MDHEKRVEKKLRDYKEKKILNNGNSHNKRCRRIKNNNERRKLKQQDEKNLFSSNFIASIVLSKKRMAELQT